MVAVTAVCVALVAATVIVTAPARSAKLVWELGYASGDFFEYDLSGTYNNTSVSGSYRIDITGAGMGYVNGNGTVNTTNPELTLLLNKSEEGLGIMFSSESKFVGVGTVSTPYGEKEVGWSYVLHDGWIAVSFYGPKPQVLYGGVLAGENFRVDVTLNGTNNVLARSNDTAPFVVDEPEAYLSGNGYGSIICTEGAVTTYDHLLLEGGRLYYNITSPGVDVFFYTDDNIRSIASGGPYAYNVHLTGHVTNATGIVYIPQGEGIHLCFVGRGPNGTDSNYSWRLEPTA